MDLQHGGPIYTDKTTTGIAAGNNERYCLDLAYETNILNGTDSGKINLFLNAIVYGDTSNSDYSNAYGSSVGLSSTSLYERLKNLTKDQGYKIKEYMGKYYQNDGINTPEANKIEKNVITYELVQE